MNPQWYFMPNVRINRMVNARPIIRGNYPPINSINLFNKIGNVVRSFNWKNLLTNANKTLSVVNQTIPLIRQTKPMINNVRSMIQLTKAFRHETKNSKNNFSLNQGLNLNNSKNDKDNTNKIIKKDDITVSNFPTFFI